MASRRSRPFARLNNWVGARSGRCIAPYPRTGTVDRELKRLLQTFDIRSVVDVGGHGGGFGSKIRAVGFSGELTSFEPSPAALAALRRTAALDPRWNVVGCAVGDVPGEMLLHEYS